MKTKMSKVLAIAASAVLLVCMLAVGFTASADVTYAKEKSFGEATTPDGVTLANNMGSAGTDLNNGYLTWNDGSGKVPASTATLNVGEVFTDFCVEAIVGTYGAQPITKIEVSADGSAWTDVTASTTTTLGDVHNPGWNTSYATITGTVDAANGYKYVRVTGGGCEWPMSAPALGKFLYNVGSVTASVGTATDPAAEYENSFALKGATSGVTIPDGLSISYGKPGSWIDPYGGLVTLTPEGEQPYVPAAGFITIDLGESFKEILFDVAENQTAGHGPYGDGYRWEKIEVSANGTDWFSLNTKQVKSDTVVGAGGFNMKAVTYSATVDAAAGYRYVRLSHTVAGPWGFITPALKEIKFNPAVEPVGTAGDPKDSYENTKDFSTATTTPDGTSLTGNIPGEDGTNAGDGYLCLTTPTSGLCVPGTITLNIGEVFTDISIVGMQNNASDGFMKFEVSADGETWVPLNVQKNDTGNKHAIAGWDISYLTFTSTVDAEDGYKYVRITVVGCPWAMPSPAVKEVQYNVPPAPWTPTLSDNATFVDGQIPAGSSTLADAPYSYGFYTGGNMNQNNGTYDTPDNVVDYLGIDKMVVMHYLSSGARFAFEVNSPKDFNFLVSINGAIADPSTVIKVYAADGFEGGSYAGEAGGHATEPATPVNPKEMKVTFEKDATQGTAGLTRWNVKCAEDIPATTTYLYLVMDFAASTVTNPEDPAALGHWYAVGLVDFDYTSDPITIVDLPAFNEADEDAGEAEMMEDMVSSLLTLADNGQAFSLTNLMRAAGVKFGTFNPADDVLKLRDNTADGEIVYDLSAYNDYWNETEGFKANVNSVDVRGWISGAALNGTAPLMSVMVSKDGETWTALEGDQDTVRVEQRHNGYYEYSLLFDDIDAGYSWVKVVLKASDAEIGVSDIQILYNEAAADDDDNNDDDNDDNNNDDDNNDDGNPDTGVVAPVAALVLATVSGAAVVINKKRR